MPRLLLILLLLGWANVWSQTSLIIDGGFDELNGRTCIHPGVALDSTRYWYYARGTPDYMVRYCPNYRGGGEIFWSTYDAESFVAFGGVAGFDHFFHSEALGTQLREPLEPGRMYYISMEIENKGIWNDVRRFPIQDCPITPEKRIAIHLDVDSIVRDEQFFEPDAILDHPHIVSTKHNAFKPYTTCILATEPSEHLAISWTIDSFSIAPPCEPLDPQGFYYLTFAYVDRVQLVPIPWEFEEVVALCKEQPSVSVDLIEWLRPYPLISISFLWKDGFEGAYREFTEPGIYELDVVFPCGRIPARVEVLSQDCRPYFFVPSAFSPNGDDVNDT
ncbi:MAG: hypothetical protein AAFR59_03490, partial [Bacteroidota bacterium]